MRTQLTGRKPWSRDLTDLRQQFTNHRYRPYAQRIKTRALHKGDEMNELGAIALHCVSKNIPDIFDCN